MIISEQPEAEAVAAWFMERQRLLFEVASAAALVLALSAGDEG